MVFRKIGTPAIPSAFIRLDDRVTDDDQYANAHDLKTLRDNHNILLARRARQPVAEFFASSTAAPIAVYSMRPASRTKGDVVFSAPIMVPVGTRELFFAVSAGWTGNPVGHPDIDFFPVCDGPNDTMEPSGDYKFTVNTGATVYGERFSVTFPVPPSVTKTGVGNFYCYMGGKMWGADIAAAVAITDLSRDSFMSATNLGSWTRGAYFSNLAIEARRIVAQTAVGASYLYQLDGQFNTRPIPGTTTVSTRAISGVSFWSASLYARAVTSFNTYKGTPP